MLGVINTVVLWALVALVALSLLMAVVHAFMGEWNGAASWLTVTVFIALVAFLVYADYKDSVKANVNISERVSVNVSEETEGNKADMYPRMAAD